MANRATIYRVFIASPTGLADERRAFNQTLNEYNDSDAIERAAVFSPIGWELTLPGIGRPQSLINGDIETCDYFLLLLWDRWGSPTAASGAARYSSGVEEEYEVAMKCFQDESKPMRQIVVLFKSVELRQLNDPGPQLQNVLKFKCKLEEEKKLLFDTFDDVESFRQKVRRSLASWLRDHEKGDTSKVVNPEQVTPIDLANAAISSSGEAGDVFSRLGVRPRRRFDFDGSNDVAEKAASGDVDAMSLYARMFEANGRFSDARKLLDKTLEEKLDPLTRSSTLQALGRIDAKLGNFPGAEGYLLESLKVLKGSSDGDARENLAFLEVAVGRLYQELSRFRESEDFLKSGLRRREELEEQGESGQIGGIAYACGQLALLYLRQSRYREARDFSERSVSLREQQATRGVLAEALVRLGATLRALGEYTRAEELFVRALAEVKDDFPENRPAGRARVWVQLGSLRRSQGRLDEAESLLRRAVRERERVDGPEATSVSDALGELADVQRLLGRFIDAEVSYKRSLLIRERRYGSMNVRVGLSILGLSELYMVQTDGWSEAGPLARKALEIFSETIRMEVPYTARCRSVLALAAVTEGNPGEAIQLLGDALGTFERQLGESHPETIACLDAYATLLRETGEIQRATAEEAKLEGRRLARAASQRR